MSAVEAWARLLRASPGSPSLLVIVIAADDVLMHGVEEMPLTQDLDQDGLRQTGETIAPHDDAFTQSMSAPNMGFVTEVLLGKQSA